MRYEKTVALKDGGTLLLRNGTERDAETVMDVFNRTHEETDFLLSYPDESRMTAETEAAFLKQLEESEKEIEILAFIDGVLAGTAGVNAVGQNFKVRHRAEFGIGILKEYWGRGIGRALTEACIECAREAGYSQLELDVVAENEKAIRLYRSEGFEEYGRNPRGFRSRLSGCWQELVCMRLEL